MYNADIIKIFEGNEFDFSQAAFDVFRYQYHNNRIYKQFTDLTSRQKRITTITDIPFLPISFFKTHAVKTTSFDQQATFESSGTTGSQTSRHFVKEVAVYEAACIKGFEQQYGPVDDYCVLALLPSYLERGSSSLVYMVQRFMERSRHSQNGFFLNDFRELHKTLLKLESCGQKTLLIGVTYALLDFAAAFPLSLQNTIVMETGGMKGRKKEALREEVHSELKAAFGGSDIHSEYGMTELLSQAYAKQAGRFITPPWMRVLISDEDDPGTLTATITTSKTGVLHIIDLANIYSCSFIATQDLGRLYPDGSFEVLGRIDHTDIRGCSLLAL
jgi:hypothetical protein